MKIFFLRISCGFEKKNKQIKESLALQSDDFITAWHSNNDFINLNNSHQHFFEGVRLGYDKAGKDNLKIPFFPS